MPPTTPSPMNVSEAGLETLRRMMNVEHYNFWLYRLIEPYLGSRLLEVGAGIGNMTGFFLSRERLLAMDVLPEAVTLLREQWGNRPNFTAIHGDVRDSRLMAKLAEEGLDTAVCINILEHIDDDLLALRNIYATLKEGRLVVLVPAGRYLYSSLDRALGHWRRYDLAELRAKVEGCGFKIERLQYVNALGIIGWYLSGKIMRRQLLPVGMLGVFNLIAPALQWLEVRVKPPFGLSLFLVAVKPSSL